MTAYIISSAPILADTVTGSKTVNCCKALNPLRRDGTSQSQRFPAPLGEDYVKIDERSIADILNFTQRLAKEFNYVNGGNSADGTWVEFFQEDLSFLLASIAAVDLEEYRTRFLDAYEDATVAQATLEAFLDDNPTGDPLVEAEYATLVSALGVLFQCFLVSFTSPTTGLSLQPLPLLLDEWYELLPSSAYFGDGSSAYSFQDEVKEARARLSNSFKKVNVAHSETATLLDISTLGGFAWSSLSPYNDLDSEWGVSDAPVITPPKYYTSNATTNINTDGTGKVLDLLKVVFDAFYGMFASLQSRIPDFLTQSLEEYPYHAPQNGLFLAFVNLFTHAQTHINLIGRKHMLYYYQDVLRFSERDLVPDQAILIFSLRKGVTEHLITQGKLLNAGKDADGKPLYYEVSEETVITPATIAEIRTVYVERDTADATYPNVPIGIYAAPIAKSSDGQGADLDEDEPKWYPFGKAQYDLEEDSRTMVDAELGWAIGSPIFMMKEGLREVYLSYTLDRVSSDATQFAADYPYAIEILSNTKARAAAEASLREGLSATYTSLKGWEEAAVSEVIIARTNADFDAHRTLGDDYGISSLALGGTSTNPDKFVLAIKVVLNETAPAFSQFDVKVHEGTFASEWPVLKLSFSGNSKCYEDLDLGVITSLTSSSATFPAGAAVALWEGNTYEKEGTKAKLIPDYATTLGKLATSGSSAPFTTWTSAGNYLEGKKVLHDGDLYIALAEISAGSEEALDEPDESSLWAKVDDNCSLYRYLEKCVLEKIDIRVNVSGAAGLVLENDNGKIKPSKPFQPWTALPVVGSRFYIGSKEIFGKKLRSLSINILWQDPPPNLAEHYAGYNSVIEPEYGGAASSSKAMEDETIMVHDLEVDIDHVEYNDSIFIDPRVAVEDDGGDDGEDDDDPVLSNQTWKASIDFLYNGTWKFMETHPVFVAVDGIKDARTLHTIKMYASGFVNFEREIDLSEVTTLESNTPRGFIRMELVSPNIAFGHKHYRDLYVTNITEKVNYVINGAGTPSYIPPDPPKEPYLPVIKEFKLDYTSKVSIDLLDTSSLGYKTRVEQFFHVHPFGQTEEHAYLAGSEPIALLPQLPEAGHLYLGVSDLTPPSTLSVLFQLAEGSADPDLDRFAPVWSLLSENKWVNLLTSEIPADSTEELIASGIIKFVLDKDITNDNTLLPAGYHWLRGTVAQNTAAVHQALDIIAQAVPVSFYNQDNNTAHLLSAMPSGTITSLKINESAVKKVNQPYASFGGRTTEQDDAFLTRVSERLRHKYRAVNIWDYERMVLEEFPSIYKAKCLNHTQVKSASAGGGDWEIAPGYVTLVTIPDLRNVNAVNPFEPKTPLHVLDDVADFLSSYVSAWVDLKVTNPEYEQIEISCSIGFVEGKDPGYYISALEEEIKQFLSPWAFDQTVDIVFGGKIHRSQIIHFIEQRDYVDFVVNFRMDQTIADGTRLPNVEEALASTSRSILVSALAHTISSIQAAEVNCTTSDDTGSRTGEDCCTCTDC